MCIYEEVVLLQHIEENNMNVKDWMVRIRSQGFCYLYYKKKREIKRREQWGVVIHKSGLQEKGKCK
jgi:hypothetical protein